MDSRNASDLRAVAERNVGSTPTASTIPAATLYALDYAARNFAYVDWLNVAYTALQCDGVVIWHGTIAPDQPVFWRMPCSDHASASPDDAAHA